MKDHEIREFVNQLRDIAIEYHGAGQLREKIARVVRSFMLQVQSEDDDGEPTDDERIMAIEGIHNCERCGDEGWVVGEMGITRCVCGQAGNSPVIGIDMASGPDHSVEVRYVAPPGYVMVPKEPTGEMVKKMQYHGGSYDRNIKDGYKAMLAAAPTGIPMNSNAWIPVGERMPDDDDFVYIWPRPDFGVELHVGQYCECSPKGEGWYAQIYEQNYGVDWYPITVTHWMPLPAAPSEVK